MPKKRVSVTLRKPASPAPEVVSTPEVPSAPEPLDTTTVESAVMRAAEVPLEPTTVEAFVNGAAAALEKAATEIPAAQLEHVLKRGPAGYRELTIYLPEKLAEELSVHCMERNLDMNRLIATALEQLLHLAGAAQSTPEKKSKRSRLLGLATWVRSFLAARRPTWLLGSAAMSS